MAKKKYQNCKQIRKGRIVKTPENTKKLWKTIKNITHTTKKNIPAIDLINTVDPIPSLYKINYFLQM